MFWYRQGPARLCLGDSERAVARSRLMGRQKVAAFRALAAGRDWLDTATALPSDAEIATALGSVRRARSTFSSAESHSVIAERWEAEGVSGAATHAALCREQG